MSPLAPPPIPSGFLSRWCDVLAQGSESPPGAFLPSGLALLSATVGPRLVMRWGVVHEERMNLWILNVGMSALARKTSGLAGLRSAIRWAREDGDDLVRSVEFARLSDAGLVSQLDVVGEETARARAEQAAAALPGEEGNDVEEVVRDVPLSWVATFNEVAPIWTDDGPGWAMDAQRGLINIYDGRLSSSTKATKVPAQETFVTALGNIPPGVLRSQTSLGMLASGFVGRWLVIPTPPPEDIVSFPMPNGHDPLFALRGQVAKLMRLARMTERQEVNAIWSEDAKRLRHEWYAGHRAEIERAGPDDPYAVAAAELFGRLQATALKVATLLAVGDEMDAIETLDELEVLPHHVQWAAQAIDSSISYITETLRDVGADASTDAGKAESRVLRYVERAGAVSEATARTMRQVTDAVKGGRISRGDAVRAIDNLLQAGQIVVSEERRVWLANPSPLMVAGGMGNGGRGMSL